MPTPLKSEITPPKSVLKNKYDWDEWLTPGMRWTFTQEIDFPGTRMGMFLQALRNAAGRSTANRQVVDYLYERVDDVTVNVWIYEKGKKPEKGE